jgi:geranylgeranylglycerol-phosphate geranylgeranyltransferase
MRKLFGYLRLMRPVNCLMMGFAVIVGAALASLGDFGVFWRNLVYGFMTGFMLTGASMAINDYYDREIDAINEPDRPIPRGLIKPKEALVFSFSLTTIGFAAACLTSVFCFVTAIATWIIAVTYTTIGKRSGLPGNFLVSTCVAIPFIYGSLAIVNAFKPNVLVFVSIVFLSVTGREITKGIVDVKGDEARNIRTLAVRYGEKTAAIVATLFCLSAVLLSPIPWFLNFVSFWFVPLVAVTDVGLTVSSFMILKDASRENAKKVKNMTLLWLVVGLLAFIVGALR